MLGMSISICDVPWLWILLTHFSVASKFYNTMYIYIDIVDVLTSTAKELWPCAALAAPLLARFRHHFCRPDSELCRMDKPEWAFRSLA